MRNMLIVAGLCGLFGLAVGASQANDPTVGAVVGAITGLLIGLPLGRAAQTGLRRWAAIAGLHLLLLCNLFLVWSQTTLQTGLVSTGLAILAIGTTYFVAAAIQRDFFGGNEWKAFSALLSLAFGRFKDYQIIEDGKTTVPAGASSPVMGPRLVIIKPHNAVVLELGSRQTGVKGPGIVQTRAYEYVKFIYDLREHSVSLQLNNVLTRDLMTTTVRLQGMYRIDISLETRMGERKTPTPEETNVIQRIHASTTDWKETARGAIEASVRQAIAAMTLRDALSPAGGRRIEENARRLADRMLDEWHITVHRLITEEVRPASLGLLASERQWATNVELDAAMNMERARATAWRDALTLLADGYQRAKTLGMPEPAIEKYLDRILSDLEGSALHNRPATSPLTYTQLKLDMDLGELQGGDVDRLISSIADKTETLKDNIRLVYLLPGSVRVTLEMPDECANRLVSMYLNHDPLMVEFRVQSIKCTRKPHLSNRSQKLLSPRTLSTTAYYANGLEKLGAMVQDQTESVQHEFFTLKDRLETVLRDVELFGVDQETRTEKSRIIDSLNRLVYSLHAGWSFADLCGQPDEPPRLA